MFTHLELRNFKAFREQAFDLAPITLFIGGNGTGKSSVLQALAFLKQSSQLRGLSFREGLVDLGTYGDVVHFGSSNLDIEFALEAVVPTLGPSWPKSHPTELGRLPIKLRYSCLFSQNSAPFENMHIGATDGHEFTFMGTAEIEWKQAINASKSVMTTLRSSTPFQGFRVSGYSSTSDLSHVEQRVFQDAVEDANRLGGSLARQLELFFLIPSMRGFVGTVFSLQRTFQPDFVAAGGYQEFASNAASALAIRRDLEDQVSGWLEKVTGFRVQAQIQENYHVSVVVQPTKQLLKLPQFAVDANQEGFGTNQLATVLLQIALAGEHSTIGIEEPEIHLHPDSQRLFIETLVNIYKKAHVQFIMTTHSERILSRVLLLVAKGELKPKDVAIYSFEKNSEGVCSAERLGIDKQGRVSGGLRGFFEEDALDLEEYVKALQKS